MNISRKICNNIFAECGSVLMISCWVEIISSLKILIFINFNIFLIYQLSEFMSNIALNNNLKKTYLALLSSLSVNNRLEIISELSLSLKKNSRKSKGVEFYSGAWDSGESSEELISTIRSSRTFNRKLEEF